MFWRYLIAMATLVGRLVEREVFEIAQRSDEAELIAVYGRRRVGKTFLVREHFAADICLELVGLHDATRAQQDALFGA